MDIPSTKSLLATAIIFFAILIATHLNNFNENNLKEICEATPCTDSTCLHWDSHLKRCGTRSALNHEKYESILEFTFFQQDSLSIFLSNIKKQNDDFLKKYSSFIKLIEKNELFTDSIIDQMKRRTYCDSIKLTKTLNKHINFIYNNLCK